QSGFRDRGDDFRPVCDRAGGRRGRSRPGHRAEFLQQPHDRGCGYGRRIEGIIDRRGMRMAIFYEQPGLLYVVATLLPLAAFVFLLLAGGLRNYVRPQRESSSVAATLYQMLGGDVPIKFAAYVATGAIGLAFVFSLIGAVTYFGEAHDVEHEIAHLKKEKGELAEGLQKARKNPQNQSIILE